MTGSSPVTALLPVLFHRYWWWRLWVVAPCYDDKTIPGNFHSACCTSSSLQKYEPPIPLPPPPTRRWTKVRHLLLLVALQVVQKWQRTLFFRFVANTAALPRPRKWLTAPESNFSNWLPYFRPLVHLSLFIPTDTLAIASSLNAAHATTLLLLTDSTGKEDVVSAQNGKQSASSACHRLLESKATFKYYLSMQCRVSVFYMQKQQQPFSCHRSACQQLRTWKLRFQHSVNTLKNAKEQGERNYFVRSSD